MDWPFESEYRVRMYAEAISRDGFSYRGNSFFVEVERYKHERKDSGELYGLLTYTPPPPLLTKAGKVAKRQPPPYQDQPAHFYCAQLLHYGLKSMKMREPAKKRLLAAFGGNTTLEVPSRILDLETALKAEYKQANEVARKEYEEAQRREKVEQEKRDKKAKEEREAAMCAFLESDVPAVVRPLLSAESDDDSGMEIVDERPPQKHMTKAQLRKTAAGMSEERLRKVVAKLIDESPAVEKALIKELGAGNGKKQGAKTTTQKTPCNPEFVGRFQVIAPYITQQYHDSGELMSLSISPSSTGSHIWGSFDFGILTGSIRASMPIKNGTSWKCTFTWRGRESTGESTFSEGNTGTITFLGGGKIKAVIETELGVFDFVGKKAGDSGVRLERSIPKWKKEYRGYTWAAHGRESIERWGKWGGKKNDGEKPAESDTTVADDSSSDASDEREPQFYMAY